MVAHQIFGDSLPIEHTHQRQETCRRGPHLTDLLKRQLPRYDRRIPNARISPKIRGILTLEKPRPLRPAFMEKSKIYGDGKKGQPVGNIRHSLRDS